MDVFDKDGVMRQSMNPFSIEEMKFQELKSVCAAFSEFARADAAIIISELYLPAHMKTIPVVSSEPVHGRGGSECGRGFEGGVVHTFEAHNIVYKVHRPR